MIVNTSYLAFITLAIQAANIVAVPVWSTTDSVNLNARFEDSLSNELAARGLDDFDLDARAFEDSDLEVRDVDEFDNIVSRGIFDAVEGADGVVRRAAPKSSPKTAPKASSPKASTPKGSPKGSSPKAGAPKGSPKGSSPKTPKGGASPKGGSPKAPKGGAPKGGPKDPKGGAPKGGPKDPKSNQQHGKQPPKSQGTPKVGGGSAGKGGPKGGSMSGNGEYVNSGNGINVDNNVGRGGEVVENFYGQPPYNRMTKSKE